MERETVTPDRHMRLPLPSFRVVGFEDHQGPEHMLAAAGAP